MLEEESIMAQKTPALPVPGNYRRTVNPSPCDAAGAKWQCARSIPFLCPAVRGLRAIRRIPRLDTAARAPVTRVVAGVRRNAARLLSRPYFWLLLTGLLPCSPLQAAHPLITEDTGTQGQGNFQAELTNEQFSIQGEGTDQMLALTRVTLSYGVADSVDMVVSVPYLKLGAVASDGTPGTQGMGDLGLDVKWRFYEKDKLSVALKSGLTFPTGDDVLNLGAGRQTWSASVVSSYALEQWAFHLHLGYLHFSNDFNDKVNIWHASAAVVRKLNDELRFALDSGVDTNPDPVAIHSIVFVIAGLVYSPHPNIDLDLGYKIESSDTARANALLAGIALRW
jgi:hypothetical protein